MNLMIVAAGALGLAAFALAPAAMAADSWGAIAYSPSTNGVGHSSDFDDEGEAGSRALEACLETGAGDCQVVVNFNNACGAVMAGSTGYGVAVEAGGEQAAQQSALNACYDKANDCQLVLSACSPGGGEPAD